MATDRGNIIFRYIIITLLIVFICCAILYKVGRTAFIDREHWQRKADSLKIENITILPERGNILAEDGRLMASTVPQYYLYIDFKADGLKRDTLMKYITPLSKALSEKLGDRTPAGYEAHLLKGYRSKSRQYPVYRKRVSYTDLKEIKQFPLFRMGPNKSGFYTKQMVRRIKPFGSLASRTIGDIYGEYEKGGKNGIELAYDSLLRGTPGRGTKQKIRGRWVNMTNIEPINGVNIRTTIDIKIQDITEKALVEKLSEIEAESGTAIVMEVATGEIKAITNIGRMPDGTYAETRNHAVADEVEPGSTFKTVSMMVALDAGIIQPDDTVDVGNGIFMYAGSRMTDHNAHRGGYHRISAAQTIWYSSNIGIAKIILKGFEKHPQDFVDRLYAMGLNTPVNLNIPGEGRPKIKHPIKDKNRWYKTTLPWMTFGYEIQIPPIYTLMFYNAIANGGKMIKPIFVKEISKDGVIIETKKTETVNPQICTPKTLAQIQQMLTDVVQKGTAGPVKSDYVKIAGKTGTAQIAQGAAGYRGNGKQHRVSFCGYFPADGTPRYTCMVLVSNPHKGYPSGGSMSGAVVRSIAEQIYAQGLYPSVVVQHPDTLHPLIPYIKNGNFQKLTFACDLLKIQYEDYAKECSWVETANHSNKIILNGIKTPEESIPSVKGMGARDAIYKVEKAGLHVTISGKGKVVGQSIPAGARLIKGQRITLTLK